MPRAVRSSVRPVALAKSALPSASMRTLSPVFWSRAQAPMTKASFTLRHQISSTPAALKSAACCRKPGTCLAEQVGVNAPGRANTAIVLPAEAFWASTALGPMLQPLPSTSLYSISVAAGIFSPTLIMLCSSLCWPAGRGWKARSHNQARKKKKRPNCRSLLQTALRAALSGLHQSGFLHQARGDPVLRLGQRTALGDLDHVAGLVLTLFVMGVVLAGLRHDLVVELVLHTALDQDRHGLGAFVADHLADQGALEGCFSFRHGHSLFGRGRSALLLGQDGLGTGNRATGVAQRGVVVELLRGFLHAQTEVGLLQRFHFGFEAGHILLAQFSSFHLVFS